MGFTSETAREAGKKSKRGKSKHSSELRAKLSELTDELIDTIDIESLSQSERIALLRILVTYTIPKLKNEQLEQIETKQFEVHIIR
tara:strand:- start:1332 stop:1589 length:258 start_codon:yes stop_codon:yes gene_type:complete